MEDVDLGGFPASTHSDDGGGKLDPSLLKTFGPVDQRGSEVNDPSCKPPNGLGQDGLLTLGIARSKQMASIDCK